jgi:cbb3-type cytochrome oxidase subunit 3
MEADMIVVLCLALFFFGGISYILWKERNKQKPRAAEMQVFSQDGRQPGGKPKRRKL